jgi:hypothetical protein
VVELFQHLIVLDLSFVDKILKLGFYFRGNLLLLSERQ